MLCYAMLCYAMLCHAMLCYAMLCYTILCYTILRFEVGTPALSFRAYKVRGSDFGLMVWRGDHAMGGAWRGRTGRQGTVCIGNDLSSYVPTSGIDKV